MIDLSPKADVPRNGWILYDGECGFCLRWANFWEKVVGSRGFAIKSLQEAWDDGTLTLSQEEILNDILVMTRDGGLQRGADAYLFMARRIWWALPIYALFSLPGFHWLFDIGYRWFNRNRYRVSRHCPLPPRNGSGGNPEKRSSGDESGRRLAGHP